MQVALFKLLRLDIAFAVGVDRSCGCGIHMHRGTAHQQGVAVSDLVRHILCAHQTAGSSPIFNHHGLPKRPAHYLWAVLTWAVTAMDPNGLKTNIAE